MIDLYPWLSCFHDGVLARILCDLLLMCTAVARTPRRRLPLGEFI
jgi:hypothetical protein